MTWINVSLVGKEADLLLADYLPGMLCEYRPLFLWVGIVEKEEAPYQLFRICIEHWTIYHPSFCLSHSMGMVITSRFGRDKC